jgi:hypothetical protein
MWDLLQDPNERTLIVNAVYSKAQDIMRSIRAHYEVNDVHRWLFPEYSLDLSPLDRKKKALYKMTDERIDVPCGIRGGRQEGNFECLGVEMSLVSKHYDKLHFDDAENDLNTTTPEYRNKLWKWFLNSWQLRHSPRESKIRDVGTPWHLDGLHNRIINLEKARREDGRPPKWLLYRRAALEETSYSDRKEPIWPERFTHSVLDDLRSDLGTYIFGCQYMCQALSPEDALFKEEQIKYVDEDYMPDELVNFAAVDLADGGADYTVVVVASFDTKGQMYVRQILRGHIKPLDLIENLRVLQGIWDLKKIAIEVTGFQRTIARFYSDYAEEKGFHISWVEMSRAKTHKLKRFLALQPIVERGYFHVAKDMTNTREMLEELLACSPDHLPTHDDILDCLADIVQIYYSATPEDFEEKPIGTINDYFGNIEEDDFEELESSECSHLGGDSWRVA